MDKEQLIAAIRDLLEQHTQIKLAILFGSVATGRARFDSDIDVAVGADRPLEVNEKINLIEALAQLSKRPVDLIDLKRVGEPLLGNILASGRRILGSDERYAQLVYRHLLDEADFMPYQRRLLAERRRAWLGI